MALNLDTRIPLLSVDPNFNPSKSFNDAADAAVKQQQMTISNRLEKMKADRETAQAEREVRKAERYAQMSFGRSGVGGGIGFGGLARAPPGADAQHDQECAHAERNRRPIEQVRNREHVLAAAKAFADALAFGVGIFRCGCHEISGLEVCGD